MDFGKKYKVGNYQIIKLSRTLGKKEMNAVRNWIPDELRKGLTRNGVPYIRVSNVAGSWAVEFAFTQNMFNALDTATEEDLKDKDALNALANLFSMMYVDTTSVGDKEYNEAKMSALDGLLKRKAVAQKEETGEQKAADDAVLEDMKAEMEHADAAARMAKEVGNGAV